MRGQKITKLTFMSIREIEFKALAIIAVCCPNLKELTFSNCDFDFITGRGGEDLNTRSDDVNHKKLENHSIESPKPRIILLSVKISAF